MTQHTQRSKCCNADISGEIYHLGFSDMEAIYCERCPNVLLIKDRTFYERNGISFSNLVPGDKGWEEYNRHLLPYFERAEIYFPPCPCGSHFRYMAAPRCPKCDGYILGDGYEDKPVYRQQKYVFVTKEAVYV